LGDNINTIKKNRGALTDSSKETGLVVTRENKVYADVSSPEYREKS
jgi:hypothetical protein